MSKIIFSLLLSISANCVSAQYLHYKDNSRKQQSQPIKKTAEPEKPKEEKVVYHEWPDCCPGLKGAIPILVTYVPREIFLKLREKYKGHLYSIAGILVENRKQAYKLRICEGNDVKYEYADEEGNLMKL